MSERSEQVAKQCDAVAHMATVLTNIYRSHAVMLRAGHLSIIVDTIGQRTAAQMEILGDMLNGMDAVDDEDAWTGPIFEEAQRLWPDALRAQGWQETRT